VNIGAQFAQRPPDAGRRSMGGWHFANFVSP
jgi:hypothetical protein